MNPALAVTGMNAAASLLSALGNLASPSSASAATSTSGTSATGATSGTSGTSFASLLGSATTTGSATTKRNDEIDKNDFLKLLVTQLQNQDPLNPMDSANFSAQLAQFSSLEQLVQINQHLAGQDGTTGGTGRFDAVSFLGRQVSGPGDALQVTGGKATTLDYTLGASGTVTAEVLDANGNKVGSYDLGEQTAGDHTFDLSKLPSPPHLADGGYTVQLSVKSGAGDPTAVDTRVSGIVTGVDLSSTDPVLMIGDLKIPLSKVTQVKVAA